MHDIPESLPDGAERQYRAEAFRHRHNISAISPTLLSSGLALHSHPEPPCSHLAHHPVSRDVTRPTSPPERSLDAATVGSGGTIYLMPSRAPVPAASPSNPTGLSSSTTTHHRSPSASVVDHASLRTVSQRWRTTKRKTEVASRLDLGVPSLSSRSCTGSPASEVTDQRDRTSHHLYTKHASKGDGSGMLLQVAIPSHRIGIPSFTHRGSLFFHDSFLSEPSPSDATSIETTSALDLDNVFPAPPLGAHSSFVDPTVNLAPGISQTGPEPVEAIGSHIYDAAEDRKSSVCIKYAINGDIVAATPARLVAHITHEDFLDYDLLSDFFLTYRSFMEPQSLLRYLVARLEWAVSRDKAAGAVVRVRTFVAMRHWILNYFMDDFEPDYSLRLLLCELVNRLARQLYQRSDKGGGDIKVIGELKKCWRRTCDVVWETSDGARPRLPVDDIHPGPKPRHASNDHSSAVHPGPLETLVGGDTNRTSYVDTDTSPLINASPSSQTAGRESLDVTSCSTPMWRTIGRSLPSLRPRALMPISQSENHLSSRPFLPIKAHRHVKSKSSKSSGCTKFTDNCSDDAEEPSPRPCLGEFQSGDLIRGMLLTPALPAFVSPDPGSAEFNSPNGSEERDGHLHHMVDSMRKRLHTRDASPAKSQRSSRSRSVGRRKGSVGHAEPDEPVTSGSDILAAGVAETYTKLIHNERQGSTDGNLQRASPATTPKHSQKPFETSREAHGRDSPSTPSQEARPRQASHMTTSSRSIMIIDDTRNTAFSRPFVLDDLNVPPQYNIWQQHTQGLSRAMNAQSRLSSARGSPVPQGSPGTQWQMPQSIGLAFNLGRQSVASQAVPAKILPRPQLLRNAASHIRPSTAGSAIRPRQDRPSLGLRAGNSMHDEQGSATRSRERRNSTGFVVQRRPSSTPLPSMAQVTSYESRYAIPNEQTSELGSFPFVSDGIASSAYSSPEAESANVASRTEYFDLGIDFTLARLEGRPVASESALPESEPSPLLEPTVYDPSQSGLGSASRHTNGGSIVSSLDHFHGPSGNITSASTGRNSLKIPATNAAGWPLPDENHLLGLVGIDDQDPSAASSFLLEADQVLSGGEHENTFPWGHLLPQIDSSQGSTGSRRRKGEAKNESFLLDSEETLTPKTRSMEYPPPPTPPPSTPLPALPFRFSALLDPVPPKAAQRIRSPGPSPLKHSALRSRPRTPKTAVPTPPVSHQGSPQIQPTSGLGVSRPLSVQHTPFILAFSSAALAAQFTLIERDALSEIDWQDLVSSRWSDSPPSILNWAEYMRCPSQSGVDIVTSRFNLVVQWAVSEILLTNSRAARAATITKLIHVASQARHLRNLATAYQLTVALLSAAVARLRDTWALVPAAERASLASLERLVSPVRNFAALRAETEAALLAPGSVGPFAERKAGSCLPFLAIYTHDLAGIAQRPARVTVHGADMVSFERFVATAAAFKSLLGLLEASARYAIVADRELVARCLWLGALSETEIENRSRAMR